MEKKVFSKEEILKVGEELASLWGGSCIDGYFDENEGEYVFDCIEHNEKFYTTVTKEEMERFMNCDNIIDEYLK